MPPRLALANARHILDAALAEADRIGQPMNVAVVDAGGHPLAFARQDGSILGSINIATGKARTAALFGKTTAELGESARPGGPLYGLEVTNGGLVIFGGGIPLHDTDEVVGAIGASAGTIEQDIAVAQAGANAFGARRHQRQPEPHHLEKTMSTMQKVDTIEIFRHLREKAHGVDPEELDTLFDRLDPVAFDDLFGGLWKGGLFQTGHKSILELEGMKWYGKQFKSNWT